MFQKFPLTVQDIEVHVEKMRSYLFAITEFSLNFNRFFENQNLNVRKP
jgi:hypothetical protein